MPCSGRGPSIAERARTVLTHASPVAVEISRAEIGTAFTQALAVELAEDVDVVGVDTDGSLVRDRRSTRARLEFPGEAGHPDELPAAMQQLQEIADRATLCPFTDPRRVVDEG